MNEYGQIFIRSRTTGRFISMCLNIKEALSKGGVSAVVAAKEDNLPKQITEYLKKEHDINVEYRRLTKRVPSNNRRLTYDKWGEVTGIEILPQTEEFVGWEFKKATII